VFIGENSLFIEQNLSLLLERADRLTGEVVSLIRGMVERFAQSNAQKWWCLKSPESCLQRILPKLDGAVDAPRFAFRYPIEFITANGNQQSIGDEQMSTRVGMSAVSRGLLTF